MKRAILIGLGALALAGCYAPKDYAEGDAVVIAAKTEAQRQEVAIAAEATRQGVIAAGKAALELEREHNRRTRKRPNTRRGWPTSKRQARNAWRTSRRKRPRQRRAVLSPGCGRSVGLLSFSSWRLARR